MAYQTYQGQPVQINLVANAKTTGWSVDGVNAIHESCNAGEIELQGYVFIPGRTYDVTYFINNISNGYVQPLIGDGSGVQQTTAGFKQDTIKVTGTAPTFRFFSNANASIKFLTIKDTISDTDNRQTNSIVYSNKTKKWPYFLTYVPDCGTSVFTNTYTCKDGRYYAHRHGSDSRNNFAGVQYQSIVKLPFSSQSAMVKSFKSISVQSNQLMVTDKNGIETSLGQVSELIQQDWKKDTLIDNAVRVDVYSKEGVFSAAFLRDANEDLINGAPLKGNYLSVELVTLNGGDILKLYTVQVVTTASKIGSR